MSVREREREAEGENKHGARGAGGGEGVLDLEQRSEIIFPVRPAPLPFPDPPRWRWRAGAEMYEARRRSHYQIIHSHRAPSIFGARDPNVLLFDPHFVSDLTLTGSRCGTW